MAVLTLALGVGANTAVFSLLNAVLLRPLPYEDPGRLVLIWESAPFFGLGDSPVAPANYPDWKARSRSFEEMGAMEDASFRLIGEGSPEVLRGAYVTASLFRALRTRPALGRTFREEEDRPGAPKLAVISDALWRRRFSAAPDILGRAVSLNDHKHTIIGVLAPGAEPPSTYRPELGEVWTTFGSEYTAERLAERGRHNWMVAARLRGGVTLAQADAEMRAIGASLAREYPDTNAEVGAFVAPLREHFVASSRRILYLLLGAVALVLLIACSNVACLLLSRAAGRAKEVAVRTSLGARPWQLVRQFLCESLTLCAMGAALGLLLAAASFRFLARLAPGEMFSGALSLDGRVLAFTIAVTALATAAFGLVPLLTVRRLDVSESLKQSGRTLAASGSNRVRALLVSSEVALACVLLIAAGLLVQAFARLRNTDMGCRTGNVLTMRLQPSQARREPERFAAYQREVLRRVSAVPGVISAGFANAIPLVMKGNISGVTAEGRGERERVHCRFRAASPGYLRTMGIPILRGRDIDERDSAGAPGVVLINDTLARTLWPGENPLGRRIFFHGDQAPQVIGVTGDIRQAGLDTPPQPEFYISSLQAPFPMSSLAIHTAADPASVAGAVRQAIWSVDPDQPVTDIATMQEIIDREVSHPRLRTTLLAAFAALAIALAAVGLYGVLAHIVGQQVPEIGLRMALGATPADILRGVLGRGLRLTAIGLGFGLAGALAASRLVSSMFFGVRPTDPAAYVAVAAGLLLVAAAASYWPARRAMRVDPIVALRSE